NITLKNRLDFEEIDESGLYLLPIELRNDDNFLNIFPNYEIIETRQDQVLYENLKELRQEWSSYNFQTYLTPFPGNWFLCINRRENLDFWITQYKKDFPAVKGTILQKIFNLIELIYSINWLSHLSSYPSN